MIKKPFYHLKIVSTILLLQFVFANVNGQSYFDADDTNKNLKKINKENSTITKIHKLGKSAGGTEVNFIEIGTETKSDQKSVPAVIVMANTHGNNPLSTYASIKFIEKIIKEEHYKTKTYYVIPVLNADALDNYFSDVKYENTRSLLAVNEDNDELTDEDDFDDLNKDGFITKMRVKHPEGKWMIDPNDERLMKRANAGKGEKGIYKLYTEGIDNDGDGKYNEDPVGGANPGINFPFFHDPENKLAGKWPGSEELTYNLMAFVFNHPEIATAFTFGETNTCISAPKPNRKGTADFDNIKVPENLAKQFNIDSKKTFTMDEIIELFQPMVPAGMTLTPNMVASFLGLGAVVNHMDDDVAIYSELADQYKEYLEEKKLNTERLSSSSAKDGSFELWMYFHLGVPSFSMNFFTIPKPEKKEEKKEDEGLTLDKLEKMSSEDFIALGEEKVEEFLRANEAPAQFSGAQVLQMVEAGQVTPEKIAGMMKQMGAGSGVKKGEGKSDEKEVAMLEYSENVLGGKGFVQWQKYNHPTLGEVEIGGFIPYLKTTPIIDSIVNDIDIQLNWIVEVANKTAKLKIIDYKTRSLGSDIYKIEVWVENKSYLPFPIAMGERNEQPAPAILILDDSNVKILEGKKRTAIQSVKGLSAHKVEYLVKVNGKTLSLKLESKNAGNDQKQIKL